MDLTGRRILVAGASSGIGQASAVLFSQLGARLVLSGRHAGRLDETLRLLEGEGHYVRPYDMHDVAGIPAWLKEGAGIYGLLDGCLNSAGIVAIRPIQYLGMDLLQQVLQVNLMAAVSLSKGFRQNGVHSSPAAVVHVSSIAGLIGLVGQTAYAASKGALIAIVKALAIELAGERIRVNCIAPGWVCGTQMTNKVDDELLSANSFKEQHPLGTGVPVDVANAAAFLLAGTGRWITGTTLVVDGGYTAR